MPVQQPKRDDRPPKGGWAPGNYWNRCADCGEHFVGDKRAIICADCAYHPTPKPQQHTAHIAAWLIWKFQQNWNRHFAGTGV